MDATDSCQSIDITPYVSQNGTISSLIKSPIFSLNSTYALMHLSQRDILRHSTKFYILIDLKTAEVKLTDKIHPSECLRFSRFRDDCLIRIRLRSGHTYVEQLKIHAGSGLKSIGTIAQFTFSFQSTNVDIGQLTRGFLIREKVEIRPGLMRFTGRFELVLVDQKRLLLKKNHLNFKFLNNPQISLIDFASRRFYYAFLCRPHCSWAMLNIHTQKLHFCALKHRRVALMEASDKYGICMEKADIFRLINLHSGKHASKGVIPTDRLMRPACRQNCQVLRNYFYLRRHDQVCRIDILSGAPVLVGRVIYGTSITGLGPVSINLEHRRFLKIQYQNDIEQVFEQHRQFWSQVYEASALESLEPPRIKINFHASRKNSIFCKSMATDQSTSTLYILCQVSASRSPLTPDLSVEVTVTRRETDKKSTLILGLPRVTGGLSQTVHCFLVSLNLKSDALAFQVVSSNFVLKLLRASANELEFDVTWSKSLQSSVVKTRTQAVNVHKQQTLLKQKSRLCLTGRLLVANKPQPLTDQARAQLPEVDSRFGESPRFS